MRTAYLIKDSHDTPIAVTLENSKAVSICRENNSKSKNQYTYSAISFLKEETTEINMISNQVIKI